LFLQKSQADYTSLNLEMQLFHVKHFWGRKKNVSRETIRGRKKMFHVKHFFKIWYRKKRAGTTYRKIHVPVAKFEKL